jgi:chaperonin cofactor prefoldin
MKAAYIISQIASQERRLSSLQRDLAAYEANLAEMKTAKAELETIKKQYDDDFRSSASYPNRILIMDALGLNGVEKIQGGIDSAYTGTKELNYANSVNDTLSSIQKKITSEEAKIANCQRSIANTRDAISSLQRAL